MEHQIKLNSFNEATDSRLVTTKWKLSTIDQSNPNYDVENEFIYNTDALKSNLCVYNDAYILVSGDITIIGDN